MVLPRISNIEEPVQQHLRRNYDYYGNDDGEQERRAPPRRLERTQEPEVSTVRQRGPYGGGLRRYDANDEEEYDSRTFPRTSNAYFSAPPPQPAGPPHSHLLSEDDPYSRFVNQEHERMFGAPETATMQYRGLKRIDNVRTQIVPTMVLPGTQYPLELAMLPRYPVASDGAERDGVPPERPRQTTTTTGNRLIMINIVQDASQRPIHTNTLFENEYIGHHRFVYSVNRLPALISVIIALWTLYGKGNNEYRKVNETRAAVSAMVAGLTVLAGQLYGLHNHNNSHIFAYIQTVARVLHLSVKVVLSAVTIAFSLMAIFDLKDETSKGDECLPINECYPRNDRITHTAILLGMGLMIFFLSVIALIYGSLAWRKLSSDKRDTTAKGREPISVPPQAFDANAVRFSAM